MAKRRGSVWGVLAALGVLLFMAAAAQADLLRCKGPDGGWIYTDNKALCPEAKPFQPRGEIQSGGGPAASAPDSEPTVPSVKNRLRRAEARRRAFEAEEAQAQHWRDRKTQLEQALEKILERRAYFEKFVTLCNRGGSVTTRDEAGIKRTVKCSSIKKQYASLAGDATNVREDLEALPEECRRAGCLPGWLR